MLAAWYDRQGPAEDVLEVGQLPDSRPGPGEVRIRVTRSGINPGDLKKRSAWTSGTPMAFPRIIPHSDGAGVIDAIGEGVDPARAGTRVWVYGAQSYRPFGTAAQFVVVPSRLAVKLPDRVSDDLGACLGIPGITAHRAVFADGPVTGRIVLVQGVLGAVGSIAAQLARWGGARVVGTVVRSGDLERVPASTADHVVPLDRDPAGAVREIAPHGVDRIVEVALSANADLDSRLLAQGAVIAAYATLAARTELPFWPLLFGNTTIRLLGSDDFPPDAKDAAATDLSAAAADGRLAVPVAEVRPLLDIAGAHRLLEGGHPSGRVLLSIPHA